jgi:hypothetical protein
MNNILLIGLAVVVLYFLFFRNSESFTDVEKDAYANKIVDLFKFLEKEQVGYGTYVVKLKEINNPYVKLDSLDTFFELNKAQKAGILSKDMIMKFLN